MKLFDKVTVNKIPDSMNMPNGNKYDLLIATESSFGQPKDQQSSDGLARGLIQVTESTRKILQNIKGELRNHHIELTVNESREPETNIAAGIRWLQSLFINILSTLLI